MADADDDNHGRCVRLMAKFAGKRYVPALVVTEVCWLLEREQGSDAEAGFLDSLAAGELTLVNLTPSDLGRMAELVRRYRNLPLGAADASVIAVAG